MQLLVFEENFSKALCPDTISNFFQPAEVHSESSNQNRGKKKKNSIKLN